MQNKRQMYIEKDSIELAEKDFNAGNAVRPKIVSFPNVTKIHIKIIFLFVKLLSCCIQPSASPTSRKLAFKTFLLKPKKYFSFEANPCKEKNKYRTRFPPHIIEFVLVIVT